MSEKTMIPSLSALQRRGVRLHRGDREVCAWVIGKLADGVVVGDTRRVTFHPRERGDFYDAESGTTVTHADVVVFNPIGKCYAEVAIR